MPGIATVTGNFRVTAVGHDSDTHHIVLDFGSVPFAVLEGQSIGIIPNGLGPDGRPHHARQYSIASPRNGERPDYNNLALTVKRVTVDHIGNPVRGVASNFLCDLKKGDEVKVIGPFGNTFLMPDDPAANLLMICTGTGSAPMRAMTERRRRLRSDTFCGHLMLFFGARTPQELPYFGPLTTLPASFIDTSLAFSRMADQPKLYVQDLMRKRSSEVGALLKSDCTHIYVCGLKGMENGVVDALMAVSTEQGLDWSSLHERMKQEGRIHLETY
jgi:benzoyl-CoA oxygenase/reductase BoxA protein